MHKKCERCRKRKARVKYAEEPVFALSHGFGCEHICRQCYIEIIKGHIAACNKNIKEQHKLIEYEKKN